MQKLITVCCALWLFAATAGAQVTIPLAQPPAAIPAATVQLAGNPGNGIYYYWIVSNFAVGNSSPAGPFVLYGAPGTLSASNYVTISWLPALGATSYDVLRTQFPIPPSGACNCAVATAVTANSASDQSNSLNAYAVNTFNPAALGMTLTNEAQGSNSSHLILRQNGSQVADLSTGGNPFTLCSGTGAPLTCQGFATNTATAGYFAFGQGTLPATLPANSLLFIAPSSIATTWYWILPSAANGSAGLPHLTASGTDANGNTYNTLSVSPVVEADLSLSNNTTGNATTSAHGFLPILPGGTTTFLRGDGTFATPSGSGGGHVFTITPNSTVSGSTTTYYGSVATSVGTVVQRQMLIPVACTLQDLYVQIGGSQPSGGSLTFTLQSGTSGGETSTAVTVVIAASSGAGQYSDTTHTAAITAGTFVVVQAVNAAGTASATVAGIGFVCQ